MRTLALSFCLGLVGVSALACAQVGAQAPHADAAASAAVTRGHAFAQQTCAACHSVERSGTSPDKRAPPFRTLAGHYVGASLQRKLTEIAETGHYDMPALRVHSDDVDDVAAYLESLDVIN